MLGRALARRVLGTHAVAHPSMAGTTLAESGLRTRTGCTIIAVESAGHREINPSADYRSPRSGNLVIIGTSEAEERFLREFRPNPARR